MNKEELCHMHALLHEVCDYTERRTGTPVDLSTYESLECTPISTEAAFLRKKEVVQTAVFALLDDITGELSTEPEQLVSETDSGVRTRRAVSPQLVQ